MPRGRSRLEAPALRRASLTALPAAVALALALAGVAAAATPTVRTLRLVERSQSYHFVDAPPLAHGIAAPSQGDYATFSSLLLTRAGKRAGSVYGSCVVAVGGIDSVWQCTATLALAGGQIHVAAAIRGTPRVERFAVLGGTGAYEGARGSLTSVRRGPNSPVSDDTIRLLR